MSSRAARRPLVTQNAVFESENIDQDIKQKTASVPSAIAARVRLLDCVESSDMSKVKFYPAVALAGISCSTDR
jgi:hypothetical protein